MRVWGSASELAPRHSVRGAAARCARVFQARMRTTPRTPHGWNWTLLDRVPKLAVKLGDALKRRFTFIEITSKKDLIENLVSSDEFKKEFISACDYQGDFDTANTIMEVFANLNIIKPLGIGILKDSLQFSSYFNENAADLSISSLIVPFFENDLNYSNILSILENYDLNVSIDKLKSLNFGTSDINGI